ncbi:hypothetical protein KUCAC02_036904, partial [Chaenocephalus aceratus]
GGHHHHEDPGMNDLGHEHHEEENLDGVWKGLTALSGAQKKWDQNDKADSEKQPALEDLKPAEEVETNGAAMFGAPSLALRGAARPRSSR